MRLIKLIVSVFLILLTFVNLSVQADQITSTIKNDSNIPVFIVRCAESAFRIHLEPGESIPFEIYNYGNLDKVFVIPSLVDHAAKDFRGLTCNDYNNIPVLKEINLGNGNAVFSGYYDMNGFDYDLTLTSERNDISDINNKAGISLSDFSRFNSLGICLNEVYYEFENFASTIYVEPGIYNIQYSASNLGCGSGNSYPFITRELEANRGYRFRYSRTGYTSESIYENPRFSPSTTNEMQITVRDYSYTNTISRICVNGVSTFETSSGSQLFNVNQGDVIYIPWIGDLDCVDYGQIKYTVNSSSDVVLFSYGIAFEPDDLFTSLSEFDLFQPVQGITLNYSSFDGRIFGYYLCVNNEVREADSENNIPLEVGTYQIAPYDTLTQKCVSEASQTIVIDENINYSVSTILKFNSSGKFGLLSRTGNNNNLVQILLITLLTLMISSSIYVLFKKD